MSFCTVAITDESQHEQERGKGGLDLPLGRERSSSASAPPCMVASSYCSTAEGNDDDAVVGKYDLGVDATGAAGRRG